MLAEAYISNVVALNAGHREEILLRIKPLHEALAAETTPGGALVALGAFIGSLATENRTTQTVIDELVLSLREVGSLHTNLTGSGDVAELLRKLEDTTDPTLAAQTRRQLVEAVALPKLAGAVRTAAFSATAATAPASDESRRGTYENEMIPSSASRSSFENEYCDFPRRRASRSTASDSCLPPSHARSPLT